MKVADVMSTPVVFTQPHIKVKSVKDMFARKKINAVPVLEDDGTISGILSSSDLVACHDETMTVSQLKSSKVHVAVPNNGVKDAAKTMVKHDVHHLVVMDEGDVVGMLSVMDLVKVLAEG